MQKTDLEQVRDKKEQEIEKMRKEVSLVCDGPRARLSLNAHFMQKTDLEQAKEKELAEAKHKLSQQEQEIETMRKEVSSLYPWFYSPNKLFNAEDRPRASQRKGGS